MQFHNLKRNHPNKTSHAVGRGGKRGKTSGRGGKGQTARAGHKVRPEFRDILKKLPKLRGRGKHGLRSFAPRVTPISLLTLSRVFKDGEVVSVKTLRDKGISKSHSGVFPPVKILGGSELKLKISVEGVPLSKNAREAILKAGGRIA